MEQNNGWNVPQHVAINKALQYAKAYEVSMEEAIEGMRMRYRLNDAQVASLTKSLIDEAAVQS